MRRSMARNSRAAARAARRIARRDAPRMPTKRPAAQGAQAGAADLAQAARERHDPVDRLGAFGCVGDQRDADAAAAGVDAVRVARDEAARQHRDVLLGQQAARELDVVDRRLRPQIERGLRHRARQHRAPACGCSSANLAAYSARFSRTCASSFHAAMLAAATAPDIARAVIRAIEQERLQQRGIAGDVARAQARRVRALRQAAEHHERAESRRVRARAPRASAPSGGCASSK